MPSRRTSGPGGVAVDFVTSGTYKQSLVGNPTMSWVADSEVEETSVATEINADGSADELYSWIRGQYYFVNTTSQSIHEWMLIRCLATDAIQDLSSDTIVEALQADKRILGRGVVLSGLAGYGSVGKVKFELYKVKLRAGEELRLVYRPMLAGQATIKTYGLLEWRQVGV